MQIISRLLEAAMALVFIFGLLGSLLTPSRMSARALARRASGPAKEQAWISGFGGTMGWDGFDSRAGRGRSRGR